MSKMNFIAYSLNLCSTKTRLKKIFFSPCFVFPRVNTHVHILEELVNK